MRILFFIDLLGSGGAQRQMVNVAIELKKLDINISFLVYYPDAFYESILAENNIEIHLIHETRPIPRILKIRKYIRNGAFDVVVSFLETPNLIAELAGFPGRKWKLLVGERSSNPKIANSFKLKFLRYMHQFSDAIVANSETNLEMIKKISPFISSNKFHTIYNMVDLEIWKPSENYIVRKNGKTNIIIAASHQYLKNSKNLIEALNILSESEKLALSIKWYGAKSTDNSYAESKSLIDLYNLNEVIEFLPPTNNIAEKINSADCCALFSFYEGLPNIVCEGMALAKPIIATCVSDVPKIVDEELGGFLCATPVAKSIVEVIRKIQQCSNNQLIAMGKHNRESAQFLFDKKKIVNSYLKILQNV